MDLTGVAAAWLAAVASRDWQTVWQLHDPDGLLLVGSRILPRQAVPSAVYALTMAEVAASGWAPAFSWGTATVAPTPRGTVVLADVTETRTGQGFTAGFALADSGGVIGMVVDPASPASVWQEAAADLAQVPASHLPIHHHLTALHHAYQRRHLGVGGALRTLPEQRFTCQGRGECCQVGQWIVPLSANQAAAMTQLAAEASLSPFAVGPDSGHHGSGAQGSDRLQYRLAPTPAGTCNQLDAANHCQVHARIGWQPIPICATYPVVFVKTPTGYDVTASYACQTVCENQGERLGDQIGALRMRLWPIQHQVRTVRSEPWLVGGGTATVPWETYRQLEARLLDVLAALPEQGPQGLSQGNQLVTGQVGPQRPHAASGTIGLFYRMLRDKTPADSWVDAWLGGGFRQAWGKVVRSDVQFQTEGTLVSRFLRSVLFRKLGLESAGIGFPWGITLLVYRMVVADACFRAIQANRRVTAPDDVLSAVRAVAMQIGHHSLVADLLAVARPELETPETWEDLIR